MLLSRIRLITSRRIMKKYLVIYLWKNQKKNYCQFKYRLMMFVRASEFLLLHLLQIINKIEQKNLFILNFWVRRCNLLLIFCLVLCSLHTDVNDCFMDNQYCDVLQRCASDNYVWVSIKGWMWKWSVATLWMASQVYLCFHELNAWLGLL